MGEIVRMMMVMTMVMTMMMTMREANEGLESGKFLIGVGWLKNELVLISMNIRQMHTEE
jgi:hypothetical protein